MEAKHASVLDEIITLYRGYSFVFRKTTQPFHLQTIRSLNPDYEYQAEDLLIREPLIEHIGSLPIVATTIYPHLKNPNVDLGQALIMLAIHDIGELGSGDEMVFTRDRSIPSNEREHAISYLNPIYHDLYLEVEDRTSDTARFAKSVDKITPDIIDLMMPPEITIERFRKFTHTQPADIVPLIKLHKHPYMLWNEFMTQLHLELLHRLDSTLQEYY